MATKYDITEDFSTGFQAKRDSTQIPAGSLIVSSQNVRITDGDRVGVRPGSIIDGSTSAETTPIMSKHVFKKRDGTEIPMRSYGTVLEYRHPTLGTWQNLNTGYTTGLVFGYADHNINTQFLDYVYFCNAVDPYTRWNGAYTQLNGALAGGEATITVDNVLQDQVYYSGTASGGSTTTAQISPGTWGTDLWNSFYIYVTSGVNIGKVSKISATTATQITFTALGSAVGAGDTFEIRKVAFNDSGSYMKLRIGTTTVTYTGFGSATTFTGCSNTPVASDNAAVTQYIEESYIAPRGNIMLVYNTRVFVSGVKKNPQAVYYSKLLDATDFAFSATRVAGEGGIIDNPEGGGAITGLDIQEDTIYMMKKDIVKTLTFTQDGTDLPTISTLLQAPNVGPNYILAPFKIDNQVYYVTAEGAIKSATRVENLTSVQAVQISDPIVSYMKDLDITTPAGIFFKQKAYIALRSENSTYNDVVLVYNFQKSAWEAPIIGWNVNCWMIYANELYFGSSLNPETYKVDETRWDDNNNPYECVARFAFYNFGDASLPKQFSSIFLEGYISENTTITIKALYNYLGSQEERSATLSGTEETYIVASGETTGLGLDPLGSEPLGSIIDTPEDTQKFRVYLQTQLQPLYELSLEISSNEVGSNWEILRFGYDAAILPEPVKSLKKLLG